MNREKLKEAEKRFFMRYPGGFSDPLMAEIAKKHKIEKMNRLAQDSFGMEKFEDPESILSSMAKIVSQSSMISIFEKPKFRDLAKALSSNEKEHLSHGLKEFLHGSQAPGFRLMVDILKQYKLAKWPLLTVCPVYYRPGTEVFIKPTTAKSVIEYFELEGLKYTPTPNYEFYKAYRDQINRMKNEIDVSLRADNAAFCGFLMLSIADLTDTEDTDS